MEQKEKSDERETQARRDSDEKDDDHIFRISCFPAGYAYSRRPGGLLWFQDIE